MKWIAVFLMLFGPLCARGGGDFVTLQKSAVHEGDYFSTSSRTEISGLVKGDVYAFGSQVVIDGIVEGDVIASGGSIEIIGTVQGSARLAAGQIDIDGTIGKNITALSGNLEIGPHATVGGNAVLSAGVLDFSGDIGGNLTLTASTARLLGAIGGRVKAYVGSLRIGAHAVIGGALEYSGSEEAHIHSGAQIGGRIVYHRLAIGKFMRGEWSQEVVMGTRFTGALMNLIYSFVAAWIFIRFSPRRLEAILTALDKAPWRAFGVGLLIFLLLPVLCIALMLTILGFPLALALMAVGLLGFYTAKVFSILWLCKRISAQKKPRLWTFLCGISLFLIISHIPFLGPLLRMVLTFMGLGGLWMGKGYRTQGG